MSHYGQRAGNERVTLVVDVDHTLTKLLECAAAWHEAEHGAKVSQAERERQAASDLSLYSL